MVVALMDRLQQHNMYHNVNSKQSFPSANKDMGSQRLLKGKAQTQLRLQQVQGQPKTSRVLLVLPIGAGGYVPPLQPSAEAA